MGKIKLSILLLTFLFTPSSLLAQADQTKLKDAISQKLKTNDLVTGQFIQKKALKGFPRPITSTGNFFYWRNQGLYWETNKPFSQGITFMPKDVLHWKNGKQENSKKKTDSTQKHISKILLAIFNGDLTRLERFFKTQWESEKTNWKIELTPANNAVKETLQAITLSGNDYIDSLEIINTNGDSTHISFQEVAPLNAPPHEKCAFFLKECPR